MSNPFHELDAEESYPLLPNEVKVQTLGSIYSLRMLMDIVDLFVSKAGATFHTSISPNDVNLLDGSRDVEEDRDDKDE